MLTLVLPYQFLLIARPRGRRIRKQLCLTSAVHAHEPEGGLIDAISDSQEAMVLQDNRLAPTERFCYPRALVRVNNNTTKVAIHAVALVEPERILSDHLQLPPKHAKSLAMNRMRVAGGVDIRPGLVDGTVDGEGRSVDGLAALRDPALLIDQDQIRHLDLAEVHAQRVQPEVIREYGVPDTDVSSDALVVAAVGEYAEGRREVLFAVMALFLHGGGLGI